MEEENEDKERWCIEFKPSLTCSKATSQVHAITLNPVASGKDWPGQVSGVETCPTQGVLFFRPGAGACPQQTVAEACPLTPPAYASAREISADLANLAFVLSSHPCPREPRGTFSCRPPHAEGCLIQVRRTCSAPQAGPGRNYARGPPAGVALAVLETGPVSQALKVSAVVLAYTAVNV
jgi:hypothetical protein